MPMPDGTPTPAEWDAAEEAQSKPDGPSSYQIAMLTRHVINGKTYAQAVETMKLAETVSAEAIARWQAEIERLAGAREFDPTWIVVGE